MLFLDILKCDRMNFIPKNIQQKHFQSLKSISCNNFGDENPGDLTVDV